MSDELRTALGILAAQRNHNLTRECVRLFEAELVAAGLWEPGLGNRRTRRLRLKAFREALREGTPVPEGWAIQDLSQDEIEAARAVNREKAWRKEQRRRARAAARKAEKASG